MNSKTLIGLAVFLLFIILLSWVGDKKAAFYFLLLVLLSVLVVRWDELAEFIPIPTK